MRRYEILKNNITCMYAWELQAPTSPYDMPCSVESLGASLVDLKKYVHFCLVYLAVHVTGTRFELVSLVFYIGMIRYGMI